MSTTVSYKGSTIATATNQTKVLETEGTWLEDDITITDVTAAPSLQAKSNIAPTTSSQTITADPGYDGLSSVQINAMPSGSASPAATLSGNNATATVSSSNLVLTKSILNSPNVSAGYVAMASAGSTAVTLSTPATNLEAGNIKNGVTIFGVTGTYSGGATNIVQGTFTTNATRASTGTVDIPYTGTGYPIALMVFITNGAYNNSTGGDTAWYNSVNRYDVGTYYMTKSRMNTAPGYATSGAANYGVVTVVYKNSTTTSTTYTRSSSMSANAYTASTGVADVTNACVKFKGAANKLSYYVGNLTSATIGLAPSQSYSYIAVYSA